MTKTFHPIRAYIAIFVLLLLIVLPPFFRAFFPKIEETVPSDTDVIITLTCTREYRTEELLETVQIRYINAKIDQTRITYSPLPTTEEAFNQEEDELLPSAELAYFQAIPGADISQVEDRTIITINQETIDQNPDNQELQQTYFNNDRITQRLNFTNRSFECEETTT